MFRLDHATYEVFQPTSLNLLESVIFCLSSFETKAQSVYIQDIIEYIDKNGQEFDALIGVRGIRYTESLNLPKVTVLEGDYIVMKATSCTYVGSV